MDHDLPEDALAELRRIEAKNDASEVDYTAFKVLWDRRYVMSGPKDTHITERGRQFVKRLDGRVV